MCSWSCSCLCLTSFSIHFCLVSFVLSIDGYINAALHRNSLFVAMIGSTLLNGYLLNMGMNRTVSFFVTLSVFACLNFFVLRSLVAKSEAKARDEQEGGKGGRAQVNDKNNNAPMIPPKSSQAHAFVVNKGGPPVKVD